ncbi:hypothetical protein MJO28_010755 [Puccinia striiformis f. sp. tritici]|uniref:O-methyltransferase C-terminal domain-containing protein n=3 Tax=Puccinia striiformis f. sp. tritici TaxID=168172 RepID=A0A0L0W1F9_9BASI|nr:hypothetical protein MJO28_010755 [Puccinia striiformis f. sp. tritici]KAI7948837.1 hypothetical protein MJO29_010502 [Puccinia striiformis f. sp. tritici]KAI9610544.1 hypothetical protein H4Q26_006687 [Puccinia striiformis f. sp. tritici PST-130]KNF05344.1 hypothetical protein PSTG_01560 [Puccinia striiformis f. sp. tritici PST-78]
MPVSAAQKLAELILQAVKDIEADTATQIPGAQTTDINLPTVAAEDDLEATPLRRAALRTLKGATHQLLATLMPAGLHVQELHYSHLQTTALDVAARARIADLIYSIDPDSTKGGVHVAILAEKAGMDSRKLTHVLRFLAIRNVFVEEKPDHFSNNRHSFPLRTDSANTLWNALGHLKEEIGLPAFVELPEVLLDKEGGRALSWDHTHSAFQKYYQPGCDYFEFLARSKDGYRAKRFGKTMIELSRASGIGEAHYKGYDWEKLGPNGILIDVGGGIGGHAYHIATYLPSWKIVVQDRPEVVKDGKEHYKKIASKANLEFEEVDFFKEQPPHRAQEVDVYFLRQILHDWPAKACVEILTQLRKAAKPTSRLLIAEIGLEPPLLDRQSPILANGGMATFLSHNFSLSMMTVFNSEERSTQQFTEIFGKAGWKLESVSTLTTVLDRFIFEGVPDPSWKQ